MLCLTFWVGSVAGAQDAASAARAASLALEAASVELDAAESARDRVAALTQTVRAYEDGLAAMREGLRQAAIRETELSRKLTAQEAEVSQLLGVLSSLGGDAQPQTLLHPQGPMGTARSGMLLAAVTPALTIKAAALRADLQEVVDLRQLQQSALSTLEDGLQGVQLARTKLSQAISDRTDLPMRFTEDPVRTAILISSTETLDGFASGLSNITENEQPDSLPSVTQMKGQLPLPVRGVVLREAGEEDAAGVERPGVVLAVLPRALVTSPTAATVRYAGPLLDYGLVTILEPQSDLLIVLAGLDQLFVTTGQVIGAGNPVGLMGGAQAASGDILSPSGERAGADRSETLYIEIREGDRPVDPRSWIAIDKG